MRTPPLVSVIIPFFQAERFFEEAIESVVNQAFRDWELLLVDDGATDRSASIARSWATRHPHKIRRLSHADNGNHGSSAARNLGLANASGQYVAFLDADDVWTEDILEDQVAILEANSSAAMVYGPILWWYGWTGRTDDIERDYIEDLGVPANSLIRPPTLLTLFVRDRAAVPSAMLIRREAIGGTGLFEQEFTGLYDDQVFLAKLCLVHTVFASSESWYRYRQHSDSMCARSMVTGEYFSSRPVFLQWLADYLTSQDVVNRDLWRAVDEELWPFRHPGAHRLLQRFAPGLTLGQRLAQIEGALRRRRFWHSAG